MPGFLVYMRSLKAGLLVLAASMLVWAQRPASVAEQYLFQAANAERLQRGLPALQWDDALYRAAVQHAEQMAGRESISHQYAGEPDLAARAGKAGARFSFVAENVAMAPDAIRVHDAWMRSPGHRANVLDTHADHVGISVLSRRGELYAVEDFEREVAVLSFEEQENAVADLLAATGGLTVQVAETAARETCSLETGYAGTRRPWFVMRFTAGELNQLPEDLQTRLASGKFHQASVGACAAHGQEPFASYNIAVLLYP